MASLNVECSNAFLSTGERGMHRVHPQWPSCSRRCLALDQPRRMNPRALLISSPWDWSIESWTTKQLYPVWVDHKQQQQKKKSENRATSPEKLDHWLRNSISEIVRNIGEAPFLVQVFANDSKEETSSSLSSSVVRLEREGAVPERWPSIKKRWEGRDRMPDGIILVEEIKEDEDADCDGEGDDDGSRRTWGVIVQGRGGSCVACYILNTTRVPSTMGCCTHFCLIRAKCFSGDTANVQLMNAWL